MGGIAGKQGHNFLLHHTLTMSKNLNALPKSKILVVDDTPDNLRLLSSMLKNRGYGVRKALSGQVAISACQKILPDIILLDVNMPDMNGYEVCAALKANEKTCDIPVIFISVLDDVLDKVKAFDVGGADYITKPFHIEEVVARVENQLTVQKLQKQLKQQNALLLEEIERRRSAESALQEANEKLHRLACSDSLTGLANRRHFDEYLQREWHRSAIDKTPLSLILCDIDFFKSYNDNYGHLAGDFCLKEVAKAISNAVKRPTDLVARYGGEEFVSILPHTDIYGAISLAKNIQLEMEKLKIIHCFSSVSNYITLSMGICSLVGNYQESPETLIAKTDRALYQAKQQGRDRYCTYTTDFFIADTEDSPPKEPREIYQSYYIFEDLK